MFYRTFQNCQSADLIKKQASSAYPYMKGIYVYVRFVPKMVLDNIKMKETQGPDTCPPDMKQPSLGYYSLPSAHPHGQAADASLVLRALFSGLAVGLGCSHSSSLSCAAEDHLGRTDQPYLRKICFSVVLRNCRCPCVPPPS